MHNVVLKRAMSRESSEYQCSQWRDIGKSSHKKSQCYYENYLIQGEYDNKHFHSQGKKFRGNFM